MKERISEIPAKITESVSLDDRLIEHEFANLEAMSKDQLIALIKRVSGAAGWIQLGMLSPDEIKSSTKLRLAEIALRNKDDKVALQAIQQLLDRLEGKPIGSAPMVSIGAGSGETKVQVILVSADEYRKQQSAPKIIENQ